MGRTGRPQGAMKGATPAADDLARFLVEITAGLTVRELAQRYGGGKTIWSEYRSGARVIPLGRLNVVVRDRVRDGRGRQAMLQRARRLHEAALVAEAEAGPRPRLDEALRRAEADLEAAEGLIRSLLALLGTLLGEKTGPWAAPEPDHETDQRTGATAAAQAEAKDPDAEAEAPEAEDPDARSESASPNGLVDRAFRELEKARCVRRAALLVREQARAQNRAALSAGSKTPPKAGGDLTLALARTADALADSAEVVRCLRQEARKSPGGGGTPLEGVVLERTDRPSAPARVHMRTAPRPRPITASPVVLLPEGPAAASPPPRRAPARSTVAAVAAVAVLAVLAVATSAATAVVVARGQRPVWIQPPAGPEPYTPAPGAGVRSPDPIAAPSGTPSASQSPSPHPSQWDRAPAPAPSPSPSPSRDTTAPSSVPPPSPSAPGGAPDPVEPPVGLFRFTNAGSRQCLAVPLGSSTSADGVVQAGCGTVAEQQWYLTRETGGSATTVYSMRNRFSGMCLSVDAARTTNDAAVTHYLCGDRQGLFPDQFWTLRYLSGARAWQLTNVNSGKCVGVAPGGGRDAPVVQQDCRDNPWLMWRE